MDQISKGRPLKRQVAIFLDPDLIAFADAQARLNHVSRGHYIRSLIRRELDAKLHPVVPAGHEAQRPSWIKPIQALMNDAPLIL